MNDHERSLIFAIEDTLWATDREFMICCDRLTRQLVGAAYPRLVDSNGYAWFAPLAGAMTSLLAIALVCGWATTTGQSWLVWLAVTAVPAAMWPLWKCHGESSISSRWR
ncbi:MAG: hypothetical protein ACR2KL_03995 [Nocardioidaceae bacterium]